MRIALIAASALALGAAACSQGPAEEAGEAADSTYEQSTTGTTDMGQGPAEEAGEAVDEAADGADAIPGDSTTTQAPAPTTP